MNDIEDMNNNNYSNDISDKIDKNDEGDKLKLFLDIEKHLLEDVKPAIYLNDIFHEEPLFKEYPFDMLYIFGETKQSLKYHPEGNVWKHVMLVVNQAAKCRESSKDKRAFMWASLLHDIGKPKATVNNKGKITAYDHDKMGESLAVEFLSQFTDDTEFINKVAKLVRYHMQYLFVIKHMKFAEMENMLNETDYNEIALLGYCDRMGRANKNVDEEKENVKAFRKICKANAKSI